MWLIFWSLSPALQYTDEVHVSDITMTTILKAMMVEDFLKERFNARDMYGLQGRDWTKAKNILKNVRVETTHMQVSRTHKISGFSDRAIRELKYDFCFDVLVCFQLTTVNSNQPEFIHLSSFDTHSGTVIDAPGSRREPKTMRGTCGRRKYQWNSIILMCTPTHWSTRIFQHWMLATRRNLPSSH